MFHIITSGSALGPLRADNTVAKAQIISQRNPQTFQRPSTFKTFSFSLHPFQLNLSS